MTKEIAIAYFPKGLKVIAPGILAGGIVVAVMGYVIWAGVLILLGVIILTANDVTQITFLRLPFNYFRRA